MWPATLFDQPRRAHRAHRGRPHPVAEQLQFPEHLLADAGRFDRLVADLAATASERARHSAVPSLSATFRLYAIDSADPAMITETFRIMCGLHDRGRSHTPGTAKISRVVRRRYRSTLREEQASVTRTRILLAAADLFEINGFIPTTVATIGRRAGVAASTVYTVFGSKASILGALLDQLDDAVDGVNSRAAIASEEDLDRRVALIANWYRRLYSSGRTVFTAAYEARSDPTIKRFHEQASCRARRWEAELIDAITQAGRLRPGLTKKEATDQMCALCGPELYLRVTETCGWSDDTYEHFLSNLLGRQLLNDQRGR